MTVKFYDLCIYEALKLGRHQKKKQNADYQYRPCCAFQLALFCKMNNLIY